MKPLDYYYLITFPILGVLSLGMLGVYATRKRSAATRQFICSATLLSVLLIGIAPFLPKEAQPTLPDTFRPSLSWHPTPFETVSVDLPSSIPLSPSHLRLDFLPIAAFGAAMISLLLMLRLVGSLLETVRLRKRATPASPRTCQLTSHRVQVVQSLSSPIALGGFKPIILLPAEAEDWPEDQLRAVLIHEEAHLQNGDPNWQLLAEFVCSLNWFNPLVWVMRNFMRREAEKAADDAVLRAGILPSKYAEELVAFAKRLGRNRHPIAWTTFARKAGIASRVQAILTPHLERKPMKKATKIAASIGTVLAAYCASAFITKQQTNASDATSPYADVRAGKTVQANASTNYVGKLADGRSVEVLQISRRLQDGSIRSWKPDGTSIATDKAVKYNYDTNSLESLDTHTRYIFVRFPDRKGTSITPTAGCGSGSDEPGRASSMIFSGGGIIAHKDGFYTSVSFIELPKEDGTRIPLSFSLADAPWKKIDSVKPGAINLLNASMKEVDKPKKGDLEDSEFWRKFKAPYTCVEFGIETNDLVGDVRVRPIFKDSSTKFSEDREFGSFGQYVNNPSTSGRTLQNRYYYAYPISAVSEYRIETRDSLNCELHDLAANPKGYY